MGKTLLRSKIIFRILFSLLIVLCFSFTQLDAQKVIHVDSSATGNADGTSWTDAFTSLQSALDAATPSDTIWVASDTYKPLKNASGNSLHADNRANTFQLVDSVLIYGGFKGTETELSQRDDDPLDSRKISLYPNPADDKVFVRLEGMQSDAVIKLYNIHGQLSRTYRISASDQRVTEQLDVTGLNKGIYLIQIDYEKQRVTRKLILE